MDSSTLGGRVGRWQDQSVHGITHPVGDYEASEKVPNGFSWCGTWAVAQEVADAVNGASGCITPTYTLQK